MPLANVEAALPCTTRFPVVVAPPEMVRPVAWPPAPMVEEAVERSPVLFQSVEVAEAHVTKSASFTKSFSVMSVRFRSSSCPQAQVATPAPFRERTNWSVQELPAYSPKEPSTAARGSAEVMEVIANVVEVPPVNVMFANALVPEKVLVSPRSVEDAAVMVCVPPAVMAVALMVASVPVR